MTLLQYEQRPSPNSKTSTLNCGKTPPLGSFRLPTRKVCVCTRPAHEDSERRALEGELHVLEAAWKDAEEIAGIADDMFLPESVADDLARLKRQRDGE